MLAHTDYLVCTLSSNICQIAYEMMQTLHPDVSARIKSLDDLFAHSGLGEHHQKIAIYAHNASRPGEVSMEVGDVLNITGDNYDGFIMVWL